MNYWGSCQVHAVQLQRGLSGGGPGRLRPSLPVPSEWWRVGHACMMHGVRDLTPSDQRLLLFWSIRKKKIGCCFCSSKLNMLIMIGMFLQKKNYDRNASVFITVAEVGDT